MVEQDGEWFAQGVDIDYAATGRTLDEVQRNFEEGLAATVGLHLRRFGTINRLLKTAPTEVWQALSEARAYDG